MENGSGSTSLAVVENSLEANVGVLMRRATDVAGVCREIVLKTAMTIQQRKYVRVEGWQAIAVAYGCIASARDVEVVPGGIRAIGEVRRISDGAVIATGEGFVGEDEAVWFGGTVKDSYGKEKTHPKRPMYACRAMAQTRAVSRACRGAFSFVVTLIDSNLSTTPAEEMDGLGVERGSETPPAPNVTKPATATHSKMEDLKAALRNEPPPPTDADFRPDAAPHNPTTGEVKKATHDRDFVMPFANKDNRPLHALSEKDLAWFHKALTGNVADPSRARFADAARQQLALVDAERAYRGV